MMFTTTHWIASSSPGLFSTLSSPMPFSLSELFICNSTLFYYVLYQESKTRSIPIVLANTDNPSIKGIAKFAIHNLCTEFVDMCTWLSSFHMDLGTFPHKILTVKQ